MDTVVALGSLIVDVVNVVNVICDSRLLFLPMHIPFTDHKAFSRMILCQSTCKYAYAKR